MEGKEGGWGCVVTFSSFWVHLVTCGIAYSCGILHQYYREEFDKSHFETSWISALLLSLSVLAGIPSLVLTYQVGPRITVMVGGGLACVGFVLTRFVTHMYELYLTLGALVGLGFGIALTPSVLIIQSYFYTKASHASSIVTSGISIGICTFPVVLYHVEDQIGLNGLVLILAGFSLTLCAAGATMRPKQDVGKRYDYVRMFKTLLFKSVAFDCILLTNFIWSFGMAIIYTFLPAYVIHTGLMNLSEAAMLIAVTGMSAFTSRTIFIVFSQSAKLDHCSTFLCTVVLTVIMTALFPEMFQHKAGEIGYAIILGLHTGYWSTFVGGVSEELIGSEYMGYVKGYVILSIGLGLLAGPPVAGFTYDLTDDWQVAFYLAGACMLFSSVLLMAVNMRKCYFRYSLDWSDSASESSLGSKTSNKCHAADEQELIVFYVLFPVLVGSLLGLVVPCGGRAEM